ncbi:hypothetical protein EV424DRAFT_1558738 [Suillus variegatus]|nr:hypothetical protein EV424DRAFT_1558738 [Suillus variegatus]
MTPWHFQGRNHGSNRTFGPVLDGSVHGSGVSLNRTGNRFSVLSPAEPFYFGSVLPNRSEPFSTLTSTPLTSMSTKLRDLHSSLLPLAFLRQTFRARSPNWLLSRILPHIHVPRVPGVKSERDALKDVSFLIKASQLVVIISANGSGKSTILKLLTRYYDTTSGTVLRSANLVGRAKRSRTFMHMLSEDIKFVIVDEPSSALDPGGNSLSRPAKALSFGLPLPKYFGSVLGVNDRSLWTVRIEENLAVAQVFRHHTSCCTVGNLDGIIHRIFGKLMDRTGSALIEYLIKQDPTLLNSRWTVWSGEPTAKSCSFDIGKKHCVFKLP